MAGRRVRARYASGRYGDLLLGRCVTNSNSDGNCNRNGYSNCDSNADWDSVGNSNCNRHCNSYRYAKRSSYANATGSANTTASPITPVAASLCEAHLWHARKAADKPVSHRRG